MKAQGVLFLLGLLSGWMAEGGLRYRSSEEAMTESQRRCYRKVLARKQKLQGRLDAANGIIGERLPHLFCSFRDTARLIEEAVTAGVKAFSVQSRVIRVRANQFYKCPWNNDNTACCLYSTDPVPKTAGPKGRAYYRIGATLHQGQELRDRPCTLECLWLGEDCVKASAQKLSGYLHGSPERVQFEQDLALQREFNDSTVNLASALMSDIEGLAFVAADLLSQGYRVNINETLLSIDIHLWQPGRSAQGLVSPERSTDLKDKGVAEYLSFVTSYTPCKLR